MEELRERIRRCGMVDFLEREREPAEIGVRVSAMANAVHLAGQQRGYLVWGLRDGDLAVVGTDFDAARVWVHGLALERWLTLRLTPNVTLEFEVEEGTGGKVVALEVPPAWSIPLEFAGVAYVRVDGGRCRLAERPDLECALWDRLREFG
jgi:predicted HTH transcriptional regulator